MTCWLLKTVAADGAAYGDFVWPLEVGAEVTAPDWSDAPRVAVACTDCSTAAATAPCSTGRRMPCGWWPRCQPTLTC